MIIIICAILTHSRVFLDEKFPAFFQRSSQSTAQWPICEREREREKRISKLLPAKCLPKRAANGILSSLSPAQNDKFKNRIYLIFWNKKKKCLLDHWPRPKIKLV